MTYEKEKTTDSTCERQPSAVGVPATYLSLCSGYDGIGIALQRIYGGALRTLAHVEIESFAIANLVAKMEAGQLDSCPVFTDVKRFPFEDLRGRVGIMSAGFPCQPFSSAGKRQATEDPRHIYPYIADGISVCRPAYVLLENVEGIISSKTADGESVLKYVLGDLEERGYTCSWGTFSAAEVIGGDGRRIPHLRKRVFILAKLADCNGEGLEGRQRGSLQERTRQLSLGESGTQALYPARPNERQNWWEEPRVVGDAKSERSRGGSENRSDVESEVPRKGSESYVQEDLPETESELGGTTDAWGGLRGVDPITNRVDRLRLLGNGVCVDTCVLAFTTLYNRLNQGEPTNE